MTILLVLLSSPSIAIPWPSESSWEAVQRDGADLTDICGDVSGSEWWDIVGEEETAAAYFVDDGTHLWFRLRLADSPYSEGATRVDWRSFGWGVYIEADGDLTQYEYAVIVDGNDAEVQLYENTTASTPLATDSPELLLASYSAPAAESGASDAGYAGYLNAGTDLCEAGFYADYFVDWALRTPGMRAT